MVETLDTKWFDVRIQFFQCATIPITELKFELNPEFQFFFLGVLEQKEERNGQEQ
jgi:hypothetical protein